MTSDTEDRTVTELQAVLEAELGTTTEYDVEPFGDGRTNDMLLVNWDGTRYILKQAPAREPVPGLLHDVMREYEMMAALAETWVPVPEVVLGCRDSSVLGGEFYLMEFVSGDNLVEGIPRRFQTAAHRTRIGHEVIDTLSKVHALDPKALAIDMEAVNVDLEVAIEAHTNRIEDARKQTSDRRDLPLAREVGDWLAANVPEPPAATVVHGDYKPKNMVFREGTPPDVAAVVDWEMSGIGNPLTDLGWLTAYFWVDEFDPSPVTSEFESEFGNSEQYDAAVSYFEDYSNFMAQPQYPSRRALVRRYEVQTGITFEHDRFYRALALYKLIGILESFFAAYLAAPERANSKYAIMEVLNPIIARKALQIIQGDEPL